MSRSVRLTRLSVAGVVTLSAALFAADPSKTETDDAPKALAAAKEQLDAALGKLTPEVAGLGKVMKVQAGKEREAAVKAAAAAKKEQEWLAARANWLADSKATKTTPPEPANVRALREEYQKMEGEVGMAQVVAKQAAADTERYKREHRVSEEQLPPQILKDLAALAAPPPPKQVDPDTKGPEFNKGVGAKNSGGSAVNDVKAGDDEKGKSGAGVGFDGTKPNTVPLNPVSGSPTLGVKPNPGPFAAQTPAPTKNTSLTTPAPTSSYSKQYPEPPNPFNPQGPRAQPAPPSSVGGGTGDTKDAVAAKDKKAEEQAYYDRLKRDDEWQKLELEQADIKDKLARHKSEQDTIDFLSEDWLKRAKDHQERLQQHEARRSSITTQAEEDAFNRVVKEINDNKVRLEKERDELLARGKRALDDLLAIEKKDRDLRARKADHRKKWAYLDEK